jgi:hypothetical protein
MGIEEEYRRATRGLGPVFLATLVLLVVLMLLWANRQRSNEPEASSMTHESVPAALA